MADGHNFEIYPARFCQVGGAGGLALQVLEGARAATRQQGLHVGDEGSEAGCAIFLLPKVVARFIEAPLALDRPTAPQVGASQPLAPHMARA